MTTKTTTSRDVFREVEDFASRVDEDVYFIRVSPGRVMKHAREEKLAALDNWAVAIGEGRRYQFGKDPIEAWDGALREFHERTG